MQPTENCGGAIARLLGMTSLRQTKQLSYLASLAQRKRVDVPDVRTSYEASLAIERLKEAEVSAVR